MYCLCNATRRDCHNYTREISDFLLFRTFREICGLIDYKFRHVKTDRLCNARQEYCTIVSKTRKHPDRYNYLSIEIIIKLCVINIQIS